MIADKIIPYEKLVAWRRSKAVFAKIVVATNGCFDPLHAGHVSLLEKAKARGQILIVGVNSDAAIRQLKGKGRPFCAEQHRLSMLAALESVDAAVLFDDPCAAVFLERASPDIYVKGKDYSYLKLNPAERTVLDDLKCGIQFIDSGIKLHSTEWIRAHAKA